LLSSQIGSPSTGSLPRYPQAGQCLGEPNSSRTPMLDLALTGVSDLRPRSQAYLDVTSAGTSDHELQRADGTCRAVLSGSGGDTRIVDLFQRAPLRIMFPGAHGSVVDEAVLVNTSGGIAGGDRLESSFTAESGASLAVTSQAAEKVYRALNEPARVLTTLRVLDTARLAWLPQETIVFNLARLSRRMEIDVSSKAELLALEWMVFGRSAHGEAVLGGHIVDSWRVRKDGRLIWVDKLRLTSETFPQLHRKALLRNRKALATLVYSGPQVDSRLQFLRSWTSDSACQCAATCVAGLLVVRLAADAALDLRAALLEVLVRFGHEGGVGPFRAPKMWSC
jgi:urease accessory protein